METLITILHYFLCLFMIGVILLQSGKGADMGASFGGSSQTIFGSRGPATFLHKLTAGVAILFLITSITLAQISKQKSNPASVLDKATLPAETEVVPPAPTNDQPVEQSEKTK